MNSERVIFHCDCNSFFASVELLKYPKLRTVPVAVAGSADDRHGIILAKNEAAKKYKIQTAETVWQAKRKCPELVLLPPHHSEYVNYSKIINDIYAQYSDRIEPFGIDESWLDVSGSWQLFAKSPRELADALRQEIKDKTGLTISLGISFNKIFAKLGSDYKKPDATTEININNYKEIVWPLKATALLYVGKKAEQMLSSIGINTIGQLAAADKELLISLLGKQGAQLYCYANGLDDSPVMKIGESEPIKSVGNGLTFKRNLVGRADVVKGVGYLADEVAGRLRKYGLYAGAVQLIIKNPELKNISRQMQLDFSTNLARDIKNAAMQLATDNWNFSNPIRMLTVTAINLSDMPQAAQTSLFEEKTEMDKRQENLEKSMDKIREKYGKTAVMNAGLLHNTIGVEKTACPAERTDYYEEEI